MKTLRAVTILFLFGFASNIHADGPKWYEHPGYWFKNIFHSPSEGKHAPSIDAVDFEGDAHTLNDYDSRYILLSFWASWCPPCIKELPELEKLENDYTDKDFKVIALNVHDSQENAVKFIRKYDLILTVLVDNEGNTVKNFAISPIPSNFLIHKESNTIAQKWQGEIDILEIKKSLNTLLSVE